MKIDWRPRCSTNSSVLQNRNSFFQSGFISLVRKWPLLWLLSSSLIKTLLSASLSFDIVRTSAVFSITIFSFFTQHHLSKFVKANNRSCIFIFAAINLMAIQDEAVFQMFDDHWSLEELSVGMKWTLWLEFSEWCSCQSKPSLWEINLLGSFSTLKGKVTFQKSHHLCGGRWRKLPKSAKQD